MTDPSGTAQEPPTALAPFVVLATIAGVVFLLVGLFPAYVFEKDGGVVPDAAERCPEAVPSEHGYDVACVERLTAGGPLAFGKGALFASYILGTTAIGALWVAAHARWARRLAAAGVVVSAAFVSLFLTMGAADPHPLAGLLAAAVAGSGAAWAVARRSPRLAATALAVTYLIARSGLLMWNAAEAARHIGAR